MKYALLLDMWIEIQTPSKVIVFSIMFQVKRKKMPNLSLESTDTLFSG